VHHRSRGLISIGIGTTGVSHVVAVKHLALCAAVLLAGCTVGNGTVPGQQAGYLYHDANHQDGNAQHWSPAALSSTSGTWLWPPAENDKPN
jgi:hypothetical protein